MGSVLEEWPLISLQQYPRCRNPEPCVKTGPCGRATSHWYGPHSASAVLCPLLAERPTPSPRCTRVRPAFPSLISLLLTPFTCLSPYHLWVSYDHPSLRKYRRLLGRWGTVPGSKAHESQGNAICTSFSPAWTWGPTHILQKYSHNITDVCDEERV